jgi:hypothetical protein
MTGLVTRNTDRPKPTSRAAHGAVLVSGNMLAVHFGCSRQNVDQLTAQGVIERRGDGKFDQDQWRLRYLAHLRSPERRSARSEAAAKYAEAKTQLLHIKIEEKQRKQVRREDVNELIDAMCGSVLTHLSRMAARCSRDMVVRRNIDAVVLQVRREMAAVCLAKADEWNEPPLTNRERR